MFKREPDNTRRSDGTLKLVINSSTYQMFRWNIASNNSTKKQVASGRLFIAETLTAMLR